MKKIYTLSFCALSIFASAQTVTTIAGSTSGSTNGSVTVAQFNGPNGVCVDSKSYIYVADAGNQSVRKINLAAGTVTTIASTGFSNPLNLTTDAARSVYVADFLNNRIAKIDTNLVFTNFAGAGSIGSANGPNASATFNHPSAVVYRNNEWFVADFDNSLIRKISGGNVTTITGTAGAGYVDGPVASAKLDHGYGITVDMAGNILFCDRSNHKIRKITPAGVVSTIAGSTQGFQNGSSSTAQFDNPTGIIVDNANNIYVADFNNHKIRKIDPLGNVTTLAGSTAGFADGVGTSAQFNLPASICFDNTQNYIYVADYNNNRIRKIFLNRTDLGINTLATLQSISIFPNPATDKLCVNAVTQNNHAQILNSLGQKIGTELLLNEGINEIDLTNLPSGVYFVQLSNENGSRTVKFVKAN